MLKLEKLSNHYHSLDDINHTKRKKNNIYIAV